MEAGRGPVTVRVPASVDSTVPAPLLLLLHSYGHDGAHIEALFGLERVAAAAGLILCAPDGLVDATGRRYWNATDVCCDHGERGVDDAAYLRDLLEAIDQRVPLDPRQIHVAGHSNGGFMAYHMGCRHSDLIASVACFSGASWFDDDRCLREHPVHVLQVHGTDDKVVLYGGGTLGGRRYPGAVESVRRWIDAAGCSRRRDSLPPIDLHAVLPGDETERVRWVTACDEGGSGELWTVHAGRHGIRFSDGFAPRFVRWLLDHSKPGPWVDLGDALAGVDGPPRLVGRGSLEPDDLVSFEITRGRPGALAWCIVGLREPRQPFAGGTLVPSVDLRLVSPLDATGRAVVSGLWPPGLPSGMRLTTQVWIDDSAATCGFAATNAVRGVTP